MSQLTNLIKAVEGEMRFWQLEITRARVTNKEHHDATASLVAAGELREKLVRYQEVGMTSTVEIAQALILVVKEGHKLFKPVDTVSTVVKP